jgi:hypothetical protein
MLEILNKIKELFVGENVGILSTEADVRNSVRSIFQREMAQLKKMKKEVLDDNKNYKLNISQFYFNNKKNDIHIENIKMFLLLNKKYPKKTINSMENRDLIKYSLKSIEMSELDNSRIQKFIYEKEQIIDIFKFENPKDMNLLEPSNKNLFSQYVDSFLKGNSKIEEHIR